MEGLVACGGLHRVSVHSWRKAMSGESLILYWLPDQGQDREDAFELRAKVWDLADAATEAAEDYHSNHDGWESRWPQKFTVEVEGDRATFEVDREAVPTFHVSLCSSNDGEAKP